MTWESGFFSRIKGKENFLSFKKFSTVFPFEFVLFFSTPYFSIFVSLFLCATYFVILVYLYLTFYTVILVEFYIG